MYEILGFILVLIIGLLTFAYFYAQWESRYFRKRGIKSSPTSKIPFFGHLAPVFFGKIHFRDIVRETYEAFPNEKYYGFFEFGNPIIVLRDLELIKEITVKAFDSFHDHIDFLNWDSDPLFNKNLFSLKGQRWREMRPALSPAFTSSKMRAMYEFIIECGEGYTSYISEMWKKEKNANGVMEIQLSDIFKRFASDTIASCAFGYKVDSLRERDNIFYKMADGAVDFNAIKIFLMLFYDLKRKLFKKSESSVITEEVRNFYRKLVVESMEEREKHHIVRPDMIHLLMEAKKGKLHVKSEDDAVPENGFAAVREYNTDGDHKIIKWTNDDLTAQAIIFILGGFDTSSSLMSFMAYELTTHPGIQKKLQDEIDDVHQRHNGRVPYNELHAMKYLDMTVSETLRKWSLGFKLDRKCMKEFELPPPNASTTTTYKVMPGDAIWIPVASIHYDPKYYPDPEKFDPERFSDENRANVNPSTYMPFGIGPRNCIGSRFALMQIKAIMFHMLLNYDLLPVSKTPIPLEIDPRSLFPSIKGGDWVGLRPRNK